MRILCTFPGKFGDLLWALPTIRAISRRVGAPVDLVVAAPFASICPLIEAQPYIGYCHDHADWQVQDTAPISPRVPPTLPRPGSYDLVLHLGYTGWPMPDLVRHTLHTVNAALPQFPPELELSLELREDELDLATPWITETTQPSSRSIRFPWCHGFTDEHFELKFGVAALVKRHWSRPLSSPQVPTRIGASPRWTTEAKESARTWEESATILQHSLAFLGCCSALHVLAVAMGIPAVVVEPNPHRHNPVFYPLGTTGPQVTLVRGIDGLPTFDARHVADTLTHVLTQRPTQTGVSS